MNFCLIKEYQDKFLEGLRSGQIDPKKLVDMSSEERRTYLAKFVGELNAKFVNTEFEAKLLLKNQQRGLITWAKKLAGIDRKAKADIIAKINKLDKALSPETEKQFLSDIVERRLGIQIKPEEAKKITEMTKVIQGLYKPELENWQQSKEYWSEKQKLLKYMREISPEGITPTTRYEAIKKGLTTTLSVERAIRTGFDLSFPLRQGRAYFGTKEWMSAFHNMFKYAKNEVAFDELETKMMSNKYSDYALKYKGKLGLTMLGESFTQREEQFGSKIIDKIPLLRGSERAFVGFANDLRFNRFVNTLENLDKAGNGITDNPKAMSDLAEVIAAATGRGKWDSAGSFSTVLFAPRFIASRFQTLLNPLTKTGVARTEAAKSLAYTIGTSLAIIGMAKVAGAEVETDPRSSDFGRIKIGNTRFDLMGGLAPIITLLTRLGTLSYKSSTSGQVNSLISGQYGKQTGLDILESFFTSKTSPVAGVVRDYISGTQFGGEPFPYPTSVKGDVELTKYLTNQLILPMLSTDIVGVMQDSSGGTLLTIMGGTASLFGIGVNTYPITDWSASQSKELLNFREKVGDEKFSKANNEFNNKFNDWRKGIVADEKFQALTAEDKARVITNKKSELQKQVLKDYGFEYKAPKKSKVPKF